MFYHLLYPFYEHLPGFNIFRYITFRTAMAFLISSIISILWGRLFISYMQKKQFGQVIRRDGPESHFKKAGTPTMGGVFVLGSIFSTIIICGNFFSKPLMICLLTCFSFFLLGYLDDYLKVLKKNSDGVSARGKLIWQFLTGIIVSYLLVHWKVIDTSIYLPFVKGPVVDLGYGYILFSSLVIVGSSNAVNLTDGLDGLAIGPIITSAATMLIFCYVEGHREISSYLFIPYIEGVGELSILCSAVIGAGVGFLWYNSYPAQIFMGDVGSLSLGGLLGVISVISKNEFLFVIFGGIFVLEAVSVILQVGSYKLTKKRIFKMAPIHHHFELKGWPEPKVIVRFWIVSIALAILSLATLKTR